MSKFSFSYGQHGVSIARTLINDDTLKSLYPTHPGLEAIQIAFAEDKGLKTRLNNRSLSEAERSKYLLPVFKAFAKESDPSAESNSKWKYLNWICKQFQDRAKSGEAFLAEDIYKISKDLKDFEAFRKNIHKDKRDITHYKKYQDLTDVLLPLQAKRDERKANKEKVSAKIMRESSVVYDGPEGKIVVPHTAEASIFWGQQTRWCISATKENRFNSYNEEAPIYIYLPTITQDMKDKYPGRFSYKYAGTQGEIYNELDDTIHTTPPFLRNLIDTSLKTLDLLHKEHFFKHGSFKNLKTTKMPKSGVYQTYEDALEGLKQTSENHVYVPDQFFENIDFAIDTLSHCDLRSKMPKKVLRNPKFIKAVFSLGGNICPDAMKHYADDETLVKTAIIRNPEHLQHLSPRLRTDKNFIDSILNSLSSGNDIESFIKHAPDKIKNDSLYMLKAIKRTDDRIHYKRILDSIDPKLKTDKTFILDVSSHIKSNKNFDSYDKKQATKDLINWVSSDTAQDMNLIYSLARQSLFTGTIKKAFSEASNKTLKPPRFLKLRAMLYMDKWVSAPKLRQQKQAM